MRDFWDVKVGLYVFHTFGNQHTRLQSDMSLDLDDLSPIHISVFPIPPVLEVISNALDCHAIGGILYTRKQ